MGDVHAQDDAALRELLRQSRRIAVIGIKAGAADAAFRVPRYMQRCGYAIVPVNPKLERVLGEPALASLAELGEPVDLVNVFRASPHVPAHVDEILALAQPPRLVWLQLGIRHPQACDRLRRGGIRVVEDRCLRVEHARLLGPGAAAR